MVSFGDHAQSVFNLNSHQSGASLDQAVSQATTEVGGALDLPEALRFTRDTMFTPQAGVRGPTASKVVIMVTNGRGSNQDLTILQVGTKHFFFSFEYSLGENARSTS